MSSPPEIRFANEHVWGQFREVVLAPGLMSRVIRFYVGGRTSVHRHPVSELLLIETGVVECWLGPDPDALERVLLEEGGRVFIPRDMWHACGAITGTTEEQPFALAVEYIWGEFTGNEYTIVRSKPAVPSPWRLSRRPGGQEGDDG